MEKINQNSSTAAIRYDAKRDFFWLFLRPWLWIPRLVEILVSISALAIVLTIQGSSKNEDIQKRIAKQILLTITNLGPCFIKIGQALSTRPDLVRKDWLEELTKLQDNLPPFPHEQALEILEKELGAPADQLFREFPKIPIAAASLGQVYKAKLHGDYWVAVKIQRPDLEFSIRRDLSIIRVLCRIIGPILPLNLGVGLDEIVDEYGKNLFEEIDYELEAQNANRFRALFSNNPAVTIPKVEQLLSTKKVITTSWVNGIKLQNKDELGGKDIDLDALIRSGVISGLQQLLEFGFFHADPHPGNMFALSGQTQGLGHIAYVDFGMMDSISNQDRLTLTSAIVNIVNENFCDLASNFQKLGFLSNEYDTNKIVPVLRKVLSGALDNSVGSFNFKKITDQFSELMYKYPFRVPARFALIIRAVVSQEGLALRLDPDFKIIKIAYPYVAKKLISGESKELLEILLNVIFTKDGILRVERVENLLDILIESAQDSDSELLPIAKTGLNLIMSNDGYILRKNLLLSMIKDEKLNTNEIKQLLRIIRKKFSPKKIAKGILKRLNPYKPNI